MEQSILSKVSFLARIFKPVFKPSVRISPSPIPLVRQSTSQLQQPITQHRLLKRPIPMIRIFLPQTQDLPCTPEISMRPMSSTFSLLEDLFLLLQIFCCGKCCWCVARIDDCASSRAFGEDVVVYCSRVPDYEVACCGADFDGFAAAVFEPFYFVVVEAVPVVWYLGEKVKSAHCICIKLDRC